MSNTFAVLRCKNHPDLRWHTKWQAINNLGKYTGARHIYFNLMGDPQGARECDCSAEELELVPGQEMPKDG